MTASAGMAAPLWVYSSRVFTKSSKAESSSSMLSSSMLQTTFFAITDAPDSPPGSPSSSTQPENAVDNSASTRTPGTNLVKMTQLQHLLPASELYRIVGEDGMHIPRAWKKWLPLHGPRRGGPRAMAACGGFAQSRRILQSQPTRSPALLDGYPRR